MKKIYAGLSVVAVFVLSTLIYATILNHTQAPKATLQVSHVDKPNIGNEVASLNEQIISQSKVVQKEDELNASTQAAAIEALPTVAPTTTAAKAKLRQLVKDRKAKLKELIKDSPEEFLAVRLPDSVVKNMPSDVQADIEKKVHLTGKYNLKHIDQFDAGTAIMVDQLVTNESGQVHIRELHLAGPNKMPMTHLHTNATISVTGIALDDDIAAPLTMNTAAMGPTLDSSDPLGVQVVSDAPQAGPTVAGAPVTKKVLVLIVNVAGGTNSVTKQSLQDTFTNSANSIEHYYNQTSYGAVTMQTTVLDPITLTDNFANYTCQNNAEYTYATEAMTKLKAAGTLPTYDYVMFVMDYIGGRCGQGGYATGFYATGFPYTQASWIMQSINSTMAHELGHNFGMNHASTGFGPLSSHNEYGDNSDVMGAPFYHLPGSNAPHKIQMNWMPTDRIQTISQSGTYTISALATTTGNFPLVLEIHRPNPEYVISGVDTYYLSYRGPIDQDTQLDSSYLNKTSIHIIYGNTYLKGIVGDGQTYNDTYNAITITQQSHTATTSTVNITIGTAPTCVESQDAVTVSPAQTGIPGEKKIYTVSVKNNSSAWCPLTSGQFSPSFPTTWTTLWLNGLYTPAQGYVGNTSFGTNVYPQQSYNFQLAVTPPSNIADGTYDLPFKIYKFIGGVYLQSAYNVTHIVNSGTPQNTAPVAKFTTDKTTGTAPLTVAFDGSSSSDTEGPLASYSWNFGDNSPAVTTASATHTYSAAGSYTATLTVTDSGGKTAATTTTVTAAAQTYSLTVPPPQNGTVSVSPQQSSYTAGSHVTLTATPTSGYQFSSWGGDGSGSTSPVTVTITKNMTISAAFSKAAVCVDSDNDGVLDFDPINCPTGADKCVVALNNVPDKTTILPKTTNYTTNVNTNVDLSNIPQLLISKSNIAQIQFNSAVNLAKVDAQGCFQPVNLDTAVTISDKTVKIDSTNEPEINKPATITFYNITVPNPVMKRDGVVCSEPQCKIVNYDTTAHTLTVQVQGFSSYEIQSENPFMHLYRLVTSFFH